MPSRPDSAAAFARSRSRAAVWLLFLGLVAAIAAFVPRAALSQPLDNPVTALRQYVNAVDPAFSHALVAAVPQGDLTVYLLTMNSQNWRSAGEIDRTLWQHWMVLIVPQVVRSTTGALIIGGGRNTVEPPSLNSVEIAVGAQLARATGTVITVLGQAPNQPLTPTDVGVPLTEDGLVAWTWKKAMDTGDWSWPAYLPMVKSAVRAMDTAQAVIPTVKPGTAIDKFIVIGFSKRGATTYLTGAVDPRVTAMVPGVFDVLSLAQQFEHHFESLGTYSAAVDDYVFNGIPRRARAPEAADLFRVVDPLSYRHLLTMPKLLLHSSGDQFFMPDSARFYLNELQGETLVRHIPNTDHSLSSSAGFTDALATLVAWYQHVVAGAPRPQLSSTVKQGRLQVRSNSRALGGRIWRATNPTARDFRRVTTGETWQATPLTDEGDGSTFSQFSSVLAAPAAGFTASFIELTFAGVGGVPQTYSTRIHVTPDVLPFEVVDPIKAPKTRDFWQRQFDVALGGSGTAQIDAATLRSYLPIPLFDDHVKTLEEARDVLRAHRTARDHARRQCLATRLNIASTDLGWYSEIDLLGLIERPLWWHYQQADHAYGHRAPSVATVVCAALNVTRAPAVKTKAKPAKGKPVLAKASG